MNHKKIERLWREEGLQLPERHKKRKRLYHHDASVIRLRPQYPNHIWSVDLVQDRLGGGRLYKMLTVLDEYTREALSATVATRMGAHEVLEALTPLILRRGAPDYLRSGNGPEFIAQTLQNWLKRAGIEPIRILPGSPLSAIASNRLPGQRLGERLQRALQWNLRREVLDSEWFATTRQAQVMIDIWLK